MKADEIDAPVNFLWLTVRKKLMGGYIISNSLKPVLPISGVGIRFCHCFPICLTYTSSFSRCNLYLGFSFDGYETF